MPAAAADLLLIGRAAELQRLRENVARGRHSVLVGKVGLGKSHLLRALNRELPRSIYLDEVRPLRPSLVALCQALHARGHLTLTDAPWPEALKKVQRLNIRELTEVVAQSLHD